MVNVNESQSPWVKYESQINQSDLWIHQLLNFTNSYTEMTRNTEWNMENWNSIFF